MKCRNCKKEVNISMKYCPYCSNLLGGQIAEFKKKEKIKNGIIMTIAIVIIIAMFVIKNFSDSQANNINLNNSGDQLEDMISGICNNNYDTIYINDTLPNQGIYQCKEDNYVYYVKESKEKCGFYFCGEIYEIGYTYNSLIEEFFPGGIYMYRESGVVGIPSELKIAVIANSEEELVNNYTETFYNLLKKLSEEYKENVQFIIFFNSSLENINTTFDKLFLMVGYNTNNVTQAFGLGRKYGDYIFYDGDPEDLLNIIFSNRKNYSEDAREAVKFNRNINMIITNGKNITLEEFTELFKNSFDEVY